MADSQSTAIIIIKIWISQSHCDEKSREPVSGLC